MIRLKQPILAYMFGNRLLKKPGRLMSMRFAMLFMVSNLRLQVDQKGCIRITNTLLSRSILEKFAPMVSLILFIRPTVLWNRILTVSFCIQRVIFPRPPVVLSRVPEVAETRKSSYCDCFIIQNPERRDSECLFPTCLWDHPTGMPMTRME